MWDLLESTWWSCLFRGSHLLVTYKDSGRWFYVLGECGQCGIGWPVVPTMHSCKSYMHYAPQLGETARPEFLVITDPRDWQGVPIEFLSPLAQYQTVQGKCRELSGGHALHLKSTHSALPLLQCAAIRGREITTTTAPTTFEDGPMGSARSLSRNAPGRCWWSLFPPRRGGKMTTTIVRGHSAT